MNEREFFITLPDGTTIRVRLYKERGHILSFAVQLEAYLDDDWTPSPFRAMTPPMGLFIVTT